MPGQGITKRDIATLRENIRLDLRDLRKHVDGRFVEVINRLDSMDSRLEVVEAELTAIKELLTFRKEFENLIRELKVQGVHLDEKKIFLSSSG